MNAQVVVVGAGYAGAVASKRLLSKDPSLQVTVVNPRAEFVERIRLHQLAAGNHAASAPLSTALHRRARLVIGAVASIDAPGHVVHLVDGGSIPYDYLVYAVGSSARLDRIGGARENAFSVDEYDAAHRLRQRLAALPTGAPVVVVGGGLTGIETAAELAEQLPELAVTLVASDRVAGDLHDKARATILRTLVAHSVEVLEGIRVTRIDEHKIELADGRVLPAECAIVAAGSTVPDLAQRSGLTTDTDGRLLVDDTLTCPDQPDIVGAGDAVVIDGMPLRMSCQAATPLGAHAADTLRRRIAGRKPKTVDPQFVGRAISLGRGAAVVQRTDADDNPCNLVVGGRAATLIKEQVCSYTLNWGVNPRRPVVATWS